jgi:sugar lactone lactonase YvrE
MKQINLIGGITLCLVLSSLQLSAGRYDGLAPGEAQIVYSLQEFSDPGAEPPMLAEPEGIALDWRGNIYVSNRKGDGVTMLTNEIIKITPWGTKRVIADLGSAEPGYSGVLGLTTDLWGNIYAAFGAGNKRHGVWKITPYGRKIHLSGSERIIFPNDLVFDWCGNLYVTDSFPRDEMGPGLVWRYGRSRHFEVWASSELLAPDPEIDPFGFPAPGANGIAFYPPNHVYVANNEKSIILDIQVMKDGSAGEIEIVAGAWPPMGPPGILTAPDGLTVDIQGNLYAAVPPAGLAPFPLSPVIKIYPDSGAVEPLFEPSSAPSALFDFPTSLAFGTRGDARKTIFVVSPTPGGYPVGSGQAITQVGVGVRGVPGQ